MKEFATLPIELQDRIKSYLRCFNDVNVTYENGEYSFGICLKKKYADDFEYIGTYKAADVYTEDERILNYVNEFQSYPIQYKGKRDYSIFHTGKRETFELVDGTIRIAK